jgi:hypothetical protein
MSTSYLITEALFNYVIRFLSKYKPLWWFFYDAENLKYE